MRKYQLLILVILIGLKSNSQNSIPDISARVDTSKVVIKEIYHLYKNYLNSKPDSIYQNPNWNDTEAKYYLKSKMVRVDRAANLMFVYSNSKNYFTYYVSKVLQIDSVSINRYQIKTIFAAKCSEKEYEKFTPDYITKLYAVRDIQ
ncbi:hypothetical protein [Flavobacterium granuli]|uniref:Uncharacterized protein n=1 Tax=Flavobacterium granuli TaxID=280093 RepID=A0A1M5R3F3_9FLAO|nr:hypothetical protein [Flavobacterium granuli]PRZ21589.1 hypothetical protein BC624_10827 [Flavobacterium granuli]SHH20678.1 hypothetical protein SAMN05443373_10927 [Flavobacterium granuli]